MTDTHRPYRTHSPETWDQARDAYLAGTTAEDVCARFNLGVSAFRQRARDGGWRKTDHPDLAAVDDDPDFTDDDATPAQLATICWHKMNRALRGRRLSEAAKWERLNRVFEARVIRARREVRTETQQASRRDHDEQVETIKALGDAARLHRYEADQATKALQRGLALAQKAGGRTGTGGEMHTIHPVFESDENLDPSAPDLDRAERRRRLKLAMKRTGRGGR